MLDTLITGVHVVDPETGPLGVRNVGIERGSIAYIGEPKPPSRELLVGDGLTLVPGFVDIHAHEDPVDPSAGVKWDSAYNYARMGVTTAIGGNCGIGEDVPSFLGWIGKHGAPLNYGMLAAHGRLREAAGVADVYGPASPAEIARMRDMVRRAMDA
ncbi:MAG: hypothetical protein ACM3WT_08530, partial [Bacillota bacterium]